MKSISLTTLLALLLISCTNKRAEEPVLVTKRVDDVNQVVGVGKIQPENGIIELYSEVGGIVEKIYKNENDSVHAGEIIIELKHSIEDANITQLKSAVRIQEAQLSVDENALKDLQIRYNNSVVELQRLNNLLAKGAESQQVVDNATADMQSFMANIKKSQATIEVSKMKWKETKTQEATAEVQLQQKFIRAPGNGIILELTMQKGNYIDNKQIVAQLNPEGKIIAVCEIDELFANKIKVGQRTIIRNFGSLDTITTGKVYFASSFLKKKSLFNDQPGEKEDRRVREIKISLDNPTSILLNSRVECVVILSKNNQ
ncbi:MAG: HlyD family efflux transporter periplasmic adaptor subunit [Bacteroidia bacterium]